MPWRSTAVQVTLDVFASEIVVERSTGGSRHVALLPARTVAETRSQTTHPRFPSSPPRQT